MRGGLIKYLNQHLRLAPRPSAVGHDDRYWYFHNDVDEVVRIGSV